ncbi:MAG TPA: hypothetical protein VKR58_08395, partial [Aquella sp.]|nr:hypothetical protein [Aquella sp.]
LVGMNVLYFKPYLIEKSFEAVKSLQNEENISFLDLNKEEVFLHLDNEVKIPALAVFMAKFKVKNQKDGDKFLISPLRDREIFGSDFDFEFIIPRCIVEIKNNEFLIPLHNFNNVEFCLPKDLKIGIIQPFSKAHVMASSIKAHWVPNNWLENIRDLNPKVRVVL